jgi:hypothetical protein
MTIQDFIEARLTETENCAGIFYDDVHCSWESRPSTVVAIRNKGEKLIDRWAIREAFKEAFRLRPVPIQEPLGVSRWAMVWEFFKSAWAPRANLPDTDVGPNGKQSAIVWWDENADHIGNMDPRRTLTMVSVLRAIVDACKVYDDDKVRRQTRELARTVLANVAAIWEDHDDYRDWHE